MENLGTLLNSKQEQLKSSFECLRLKTLICLALKILTDTRTITDLDSSHLHHHRPGDGNINE